MNAANIFDKRINKLINENNYTELVRKDWEQFDENFISGLQTICHMNGSKRRLNPRPKDGALLMPPGRGLLSDFRKVVAAEMPCKENKPYIAALSSEAN
jgi:hypothetical protein